jgi:erythritol kinase (D-erythritol 1-phosphate-forming)
MIIGIDAGTSVTKAAALDDTGEVLAIESRPTRLSHPGPGRVEQDAAEVFDSVTEVLDRVRDKAGRPDAIGVTGQGDGLWLLDADGGPAAPAVSWMDGRASALVDGWMADGTFAELFRRTGNAPFPGAGTPILAMLQREDPAVLDRAATAAHCKDMVMQRLTGVRATDLSDASNLFTDIHVRRRDPALLALAGLDGRADLLPPVEPELPVGELADGTPVTAAPYDLPASIAGAGVTATGDGLLTVGTTLACQVLVDALNLGDEPGGQTLLTPDGWIRAMPAMVGTAALDWVLQLVGAEHSRLDALLSESPPGANGVRVLPYLSPSGERAPFAAPGIRGRVDGLELARNTADLVRGFCEGLAFAARHCFDAAGLTGSLAVCGGGAASRPWLQIFADVMGRPLRIARGPEVGARGAALCAAQRLGLGPDHEAWTRSTEWVEPSQSGAYDDAYARYLTDVTALRGRL